MAEIKDSQLIRDALGSPVPQYWDETSQMYIARTVDGSFADVDFSKVRLLRDKLGSPIPQLWDTETAKFVPGKGGANGEVTIESVPGLKEKLDETTATLAETEQNRKVITGLGTDAVQNKNIIQTQIDGLANGDELYIPAGSWAVESTLFVSNKNNIKIIGIGKCELRFNGSVYAGIFVHGGNLTARTNQACKDFAMLDFDGSRSENVELRNLFLKSNIATNLNTAIHLDWTKNCQINNCSVRNGDGNNFEIRHSNNPKLTNIISTDCANYGVFFFQCTTPRIQNFDIANCRRGIVVKHNYKNNTNSATIEKGAIRNCTDMYIGGGENYTVPDSAYYVAGSEIVDNVTINDVVFEVTNVPTVSVIDIGVYADRWKLSGLKFLCNGLNIFVFNIGNVGDFYTGGNGVTGGNHVIKNVDINNLDCIRGIYYGTSFSVEDIVLTDSKYLLLIDRDPVNVNTSKLSRIEVKNIRTVRCSQKLGVSGESGIIRSHASLEELVIENNRVVVDVIDYGTNNFFSFFHGAGKKTRIVNNHFVISSLKGTATFTLQHTLANYTDVIGNYFLLHSIAAIRALIAGSASAVDGAKIDKNTFEIAGTYTANNAYAIQTTTPSSILSNVFLGAWTGQYLDQSSPYSLSLGARRIVYGTAMPTAGSWQRDDLVLLLNKAEAGTAGSKYISLGFKRITTGSANVLNTDWLELRCLTGN